MTWTGSCITASPICRALLRAHPPLRLGNATMPFMLALADKGWKQACADDPHLLAGLNVHAGKLTYYAVGEALGIDVISPEKIIKR